MVQVAGNLQDIGTQIDRDFEWGSSSVRYQGSNNHIYICRLALFGQHQGNSNPKTKQKIHQNKPLQNQNNVHSAVNKLPFSFRVVVS